MIGEAFDQVRTRYIFKGNKNVIAMISQIKPKNISDAIKDHTWIEAMP